MTKRVKSVLNADLLEQKLDIDTLKLLFCYFVESLQETKMVFETKMHDKATTQVITMLTVFRTK